MPSPAGQRESSTVVYDVVTTRALHQTGPVGDARCMPAQPAGYLTRHLTPETWDDFAGLVEENNGVWGGCWCMGFHPEGLARTSPSDNHVAKQAHVNAGSVHQVLVYQDDRCVGWCQYGSPVELPNIKNPAAYQKAVVELPDWRIGCIFTGKGHRGQGVARAAVSAVLDAIREAGGGLVVWLANLSEEPQSVALEGFVGKRGRIARLDLDSFTALTADPDALAGLAAEGEVDSLELGPYAVLRLEIAR